MMSNVLGRRYVTARLYAGISATAKISLVVVETYQSMKSKITMSVFCLRLLVAGILQTSGFHNVHEIRTAALRGSNAMATIM